MTRNSQPSIWRLVVLDNLLFRDEYMRANKFQAHEKNSPVGTLVIWPVRLSFLNSGLNTLMVGNPLISYMAQRPLLVSTSQSTAPTLTRPLRLVATFFHSGANR